MQLGMAKCARNNVSILHSHSQVWVIKRKKKASQEKRGGVKNHSNTTEARYGERSVILIDSVLERANGNVTQTGH